MKILIWFLGILVFGIINTVVNMGGIPTAIVWLLMLAAVYALCNQVDKRRIAKNPLKYLKKAVPPQREVGDGEWACPACGNVNKNTYSLCVKCRMEQTIAQEWYLKHQKKPTTSVREPRPGDWTCPACGSVHDKGIARCWKCGKLKKDILL